MRERKSKAHYCINFFARSDCCGCGGDETELEELHIATFICSLYRCQIALNIKVICNMHVKCLFMLLLALLLPLLNSLSNSTKGKIAVNSLHMLALPFVSLALHNNYTQLCTAKYRHTQHISTTLPAACGLLTSIACILSYVPTASSSPHLTLVLSFVFLLFVAILLLVVVVVVVVVVIFFISASLLIN